MLDDEDARLRAVVLQNANSILLARQRAEEELLRTREALRESQERLKAALSAAGTGTFRWQIRTQNVDCDENLIRLFGLGSSRTPSTYDDFLQAIHADDRPGVIAQLERCARDGVDFDMRFRVVWPDGSIHWIEDKAKVVRGIDGMPSYMTGACTDVTARKEAETALEEQSRILELLNETGTTLASMLDLESTVQAVIDAAMELSGAEFGEFLNRADDGDARAPTLFAPPFFAEEPVRCADIQHDHRFRGLPQFGTPPPAGQVRSYLAVAVRSRSGEVIGGLFFGHARPGVFTDRTERLIAGVAAQAGVAIDNARLYEAAQCAAEERRALLDSERAARSQAERMSDMKDEFLATLSHELRTPLNAILGWSQVLRSGPTQEPDLRKGLETIERNARVQTQLIEDLLDMSRITSGKLRLDVQQIQPVTFVEAAIETVRPAAVVKGIRIEAFIDPSAGPISGDPGRLQQVVWNLLSNAIKFTPKGGKVQVLLERVNSHIQISVADTGVGIKSEFLPHLFERFRQGDASTTRKYGGLGLGLSIVKSLVELHGGTVSVTSPGEGLGTTVTVHVPLTVVYRGADAGERLHPAATPIAAVSFMAADLQGLKVLVVDDQADARDLIQRVLEDCGADVTATATAAAAVDLVPAFRPDVLVSDIGMPDVDGFELLKRVRALGADRGGKVPAIALTAFARSEDRTRALRAGFLVHVSKPVDPSELVATVASVAGRFGKPPD